MELEQYFWYPNNTVFESMIKITTLNIPTTWADSLSIVIGLFKDGSNQRADKNYQDRDNLYCCDALWKEESGKEQDKDDGGLTKHGNQGDAFALHRSSPVIGAKKIAEKSSP